MYLRGDNSILVPAVFRKLWLYLPRRLVLVAYRRKGNYKFQSDIRKPGEFADIKAIVTTVYDVFIWGGGGDMGIFTFDTSTNQL
jgi:hypothetical protein